jgi:hypothetical protein
MFVVFNATFSNISVILWQSVLIVAETRITGVWQVTDKLCHIMLPSDGKSSPCQGELKKYSISSWNQIHFDH